MSLFFEIIFMVTLIKVILIQNQVQWLVHKGLAFIRCPLENQVSPIIPLLKPIDHLFFEQFY